MTWLPSLRKIQNTTFFKPKITPLLSYLLAFGVSSRTVHFRR